MCSSSENLFVERYHEQNVQVIVHFQLFEQYLRQIGMTALLDNLRYFLILH
jgi:hypothetical protein